MKKIYLFILQCIFAGQLFSQELTVVNLTCESKTDPLGIDNISPGLSWQILSNGRGVLQTACQVIVSGDSGKINRNTGDYWDTKKINSSKSLHIPYKGKQLISTQTYYWKVRVWDNKKNVSHWSKMAVWQMGLLSKKDWRDAQWIAYEKMPDSLRIVPAEPGKGNKKRGELNDVLPLMRKSFVIKKMIKKATAFICGLGQFEMSLNGEKVGDHFLDPGWTEYDKEVLYSTFDITNQLKPGPNAVGVMLGNGFYFIPRNRRYRKLTGAYGFPKMICLVDIEYKDGSDENIISDLSWKAHEGPVTYSGIYGGEDYNANLEEAGWNTASYNDKNWKQVLSVNGSPQLRSQLSEPVKVKEIFKAKKITRISDSIFVYDLGQNASGIPQITLMGKKGDTVKIIPAELLNENGTANQRATGSPHYYEYILKGGAEESWQSRFSYYGFRYIQVEKAVPAGEENIDRLPVVINLEGLHTRNDAQEIGSFTCSNNLFNRTDTLISWAIKSNMMSVLTDCPHREKLGWLEQVHLMGNSIQYNYNVENLFRKTVKDIINAQTVDGLVPEIAPEYVLFDFAGGMFRDSPEWGSASILLPWYLYQWYGDRKVLKESYPMMQRYLSYLKKKAKDNILSQGLGDWYDLGPKPPGVSQLTPKGITGTAIYYYDLNVISKISMLLGKKEDALQYDKLAASVKTSFNKTFFDKKNKEYGTGSQAANAMAIFMKLVEPEYKAAVLENLIKDIRSRNNSLTAGDIGYRYLLKVLDDEGRSDVIFEMNNRTDVPGYGYQLAHDATSLTESWQALPSVSNNHLMLGHLMEWFYSGLAGIRQNDASVAYKNIVIRPEPVGDIIFAKASYKSSYGLILSEWKKEKNIFELTVNIPVNSSAAIYLPARTSAVITEGGRSIKNRDDIKFSGYKKGKALVAVGSGNYTFKVNN